MLGRHRYTHVAVIVLVIFAALTAAVLLALRPAPENAHFRGKTVTEWALEAAMNNGQAKDALKSLGPQAVPGLMRLVQYRDSLLRRKLWQWQPRLPQRWARLIAQKIRRPDAFQYREAGARGLGLVGADAKAAVPMLVSALRDKAGRVRWEAATALGHIGAAAVPGLTASLRDRDPDVRHAAVFALGEIGPDAGSAASALGECLGDTNEEIRASALYSLSMIGTAAVPVLVDAREHGPTNVQASAAEALGRIHSGRSGR